MDIVHSRHPSTGFAKYLTIYYTILVSGVNTEYKCRAGVTEAMQLYIFGAQQSAEEMRPVPQFI